MTPAPIGEHNAISPLESVDPPLSPLVDDVELRAALVGEFRASAQAARDAAANAEGEPRSAVHNYRKALRRARAVLTLVAGDLPKSERAAIRHALRQARRGLGQARDHAVAPPTLEHLALRDTERTAAHDIIAKAAAAQPSTAEAKQLLAEGAARALAQVEALEAALPSAVRWSSVIKGVRSTYRTARRARRASKRDATAFHRWRRRSKELTYQLDVLARLVGDAVRELYHRCETATDAQGPAVDLIMVRQFVRSHAEGIAPDAIGGLLDEVERQLDDLMRDARDAGKAMFRAKPRKFARRLAKAIRSHTPDHDAALEPGDEQIDR